MAGGQTSGAVLPTRSEPAAAPRRRADVQGLRAVAVLLVVAFHAGLDVPGGFVGVDVFFVISGFVITRMLVGELSPTGRLRFGAFYARRVRRILPALAVMLAVVAILAFGAVSPLEPKQTTAKTGIAAATFSANIYLYGNPRGYFGAAPDSNPLLHTWSLAVEEQFYLVFPALLAGAWAIGRRRRRPAAWTAGTLAVVGLGSFLLNVAATRGIVFNERFAFYMAPTRAWEFAAGALLVFAPQAWRRLGPRVATGLALAGTGLVAAGAALIDGSTHFPGTAALLPVGGTVLLVTAGSIAPNPVSGALGSRVLGWIGDRSYSWYLWHWPCIVFAHAIWPNRSGPAYAAALASLIPAALSYRFVEEPLRHDRRIVGRRALTLAGVCILVPVVACVALSRIKIPTSSAATRARLAALSTRHADEIRHCDDPRFLIFERPQCTWAPAAGGGSRTVALVGDSNAGQFTEPVHRAASRLGATFAVATDHGCRFGDVVVVRRGGADRGCRRHVLATVRTLLAHHPDVVVIGSSSPEIVQPAAIGLRDPVTGKVTHDRREKARLWQDGVERIETPLRRAGIRVVTIDTIPQFPTWQPNCAAVRAYLSPESCGVTAPAARLASFRAAAVAAEHAAARATGAMTTDVADLMCTARTCRTNRGDTWYYRDGNHISVRAAVTLTPRFVSLLRVVLGPGQDAASSASGS